MMLPPTANVWVRCATASLLAAVIGCQNGPARTAPAATAVNRPANVMSARTLDVMAVALADELKDCPADQVVFIGTGLDGADPPDELLRRLRATHRFARPASEARYPKRGEKEAVDTYRGVEDPTTGHRTSVYRAEIIEWESDTKVRMNVGRYGGPLDAGGREVTLEWAGGVWSIESTGRSWVS